MVSKSAAGASAAKIEVSSASSDAKTQRLQHFWQKYFSFYDTLNESPPYRRMVQRHAELLQPSPGDTILDAGAGTGNVTQVLAVPGAHVTGVDFCAPALERCRRKVPAAEFRFADLKHPLPFDTASFDKAASSLVLHYLTPEQQVFAVGELRRVLKPGGPLAITVFATGFKTARVYLETLRDRRRADGVIVTAGLALRYLFNTARIFYYVWRIKRAEHSGDYRFATADDLVTMLTSGGFEVVSVEPSLAGQCWTAFARASGVPSVRSV
jgi:ubiquinone/menaquinone biosynthesis C-methylase UbiE